MDLLKEVATASNLLDEIEVGYTSQDTKDKITKLWAHKIEAGGDADKLRQFVSKTNQLYSTLTHTYKPQELNKEQEFLREGALDDHISAVPIPKPEPEPEPEPSAVAAPVT